LDDDGGAGWRAILRTLKTGKPARPEQRHPRPHQKKAIADALKHFERGNATRGRLIMACGTGKTLIALWIARRLRAKRILVAVPSLQLIKQGVEDWTREFLAHGEKPDWMCVCSDETVGDLDAKNVDEFVTYAYESGLPTESDPKDIAKRLCAPV